MIRAANFSEHLWTVHFSLGSNSFFSNDWKCSWVKHWCPAGLCKNHSENAVPLEFSKADAGDFL